MPSLQRCAGAVTRVPYYKRRAARILSTQIVRATVIWQPRRRGGDRSDTAVLRSAALLSQDRFTASGV